MKEERGREEEEKGKGKNQKKEKEKRSEKKEGGRWNWERRERWLQGTVRDDESKQTEEEGKIER